MKNNFMEMLNPYTIISKNDHVISRLLEKPTWKESGNSENNVEMLILNPMNGQIKVLNEIGSRIWCSIDGEKSILEIVDLLMLEYEVQLDEVMNDTLLFIEDLARNGLVEVK